MQQTTNKLIAGLIILLGLAVGYLYDIYFVESFSLVTPALSQKVSPEKLQKMIGEINWKIIDSDQFKSLEAYGESPVDKGVTGKKDIFAPI
ncbi:MAG: hypothetical protein UT43_C0007G0004 [Parcubacteria group bacterium GW2011_GWC1_39_29]|uniref:Uncharacterized protein n=1 Tax=Candidatus Yanofskybacteria bacterium GW2011_GWD1_39_16 TaxID=1619030 RepID=A0A837HQ00_9BACT|nr:MAG: hypothetical protein UT35_C0003G0014 [Candidatus Yanofskybacteria bacterium GW2011_GWD1_39_16]KKR15095.1 MAG: hypothetical protein UT43_C0007G0004 [Parcubacteria group bacterium GW2011_GWC1_39_29]